MEVEKARLETASQTHTAEYRIRKMQVGIRRIEKD